MCPHPIGFNALEARTLDQTVFKYLRNMLLLVIQSYNHLSYNLV